MISWTEIGKLKPKARRSSRVICETLTPGGSPAKTAAASADADLRLRSRFELIDTPDEEPLGPGMPGVDVADDM